MLNREQKRLRAYSVYALRDPRDMRIRYIGMSGDPHKRFVQHCGCPYDVKRHWVLELRELGLKPKLDVLFSGLQLDSAELVERRLAFLHCQVYGLIVGGRYVAKRLAGSKSIFVMALAPSDQKRKEGNRQESLRSVYVEPATCTP